LQEEQGQGQEEEEEEEEQEVKRLLICERPKTKTSWEFILL
jgi:hypothetical protein